MIKYKHIEASRELRLWVTQVGVPVAMVTALYLKDPENRKKAKRKLEDFKYTVKEKFAK